MTAINISRGDILTIEAKGHAGYSEKGADIVCSAISILAYSLAEYISAQYDAEMLKEEPVIVLNAGDLKIECKPTEEALQNITNIFAFAELGFALIANTYPDNVIINESSLR